MGKKSPWVGRLHEIRRAVRNSVRSHYERKDIEDLFGLRPRAAQRLMATVSVSNKVGCGHLVSRESLSDFLDRVFAAEDPDAAMRECRRTTADIPRKKLRDLVQTDFAITSLDGLPE